MAKKVAILGTGIIGSEAESQFGHAGYEIVAAVSSRTLKHADGHVTTFQGRGNPDEIGSHLMKICEQGLDLVVSALPSAGPKVAEKELALTLPLLKMGKSVVIAGKAMLSDYFHEVAPHRPQMGINASVGGATEILSEMRNNLRFDTGQPSVVELVLNGTLSYIQTGVWADRPLEAVVREAVLNKFAEPGLNGQERDPFDIFEAEAEGDVPKKVRIILQEVYGRVIGRRLLPNDVRVTPLIDKDLLKHVSNETALRQQVMWRLTASNARRKYVVRISTVDLPPQVEQGSPGSIWANIDGKVFVSGGFYHIPYGSALDMWVPNSGPGNAVHISQGGRVRIAKADGAGALATVGTLLKDARALCPPLEQSAPNELAKSLARENVAIA